MKKIMFNDKFGLTQAVLEGRKTQTRRIITCPSEFKSKYVAGFHVYRRQSDGFISEICMYDEDGRDFDEGQITPKYKVGEIVAVAQRYKDIFSEFSQCKNPQLNICVKNPTDTAGWSNKMFVQAEVMPHQIRITRLRLQRLQDISDDDCLAEGVELNTRQYEYDGTKYYCVRGLGHWRSFGCYNYESPREAYAALIDKVSGQGTWDSNPYVFVYDFELIK